MILVFKDSQSEIYQSDYLETLSKVPSRSTALVLTDGPFGIDYRNNYTNNPHERIEGDDREFSYYPLAELSKKILKESSAIFAYTGWSTYPDHFKQFKRAGFKMHEPLQIQKRASGKTGLKIDFQSNVDWIIYGTLGKFQFRKTKLIRNKRRGTIPNPGRNPVPEWKTRFPSAWFGPEFPYSTANPQILKKWRHPTPKNSICMEWIIKITTDPGDLVVDPFCGSGSVAEAARNCGRKFIGGDIKHEYAKMTAQRIQDGLSVFDLSTQ